MKKVLLNAMLVGAIAFTACKKDEDKNGGGGTTPDSVTEFDTIVDVVDEDAGLSIKTVTIKDNGEGIGDVTLEKETVYVLDGKVFVNDGQTLTIEAGTIVKGESGQNSAASALVVARGGKIMAEGSKTEPIIFTSKTDNVTRYTDGSYKMGDLLDENVRGQWGGIIVLGKSTINEPVEGGESSVEGIPTNEGRGLYGGTDNADNSGVLKYISIRHGGTDIGAGNEINGLTLAGVGSGTTIEYIEVIGNKDDGIEFFGGSVNVKYAVVYSNGDDCFDWDQGYVGKGQFWLAVNPGDRAFECDGDDTPGNSPFTTPTVSNITVIGTGGKPMTLRENSGGFVSNMLAYNFKQAIDLQNENTPDALDRFEGADGKLEYIYFSEVPSTDGATVFSYNGDTKTDQSSNTSIIENSENDATDWGLSLTNLAEDKTGASPSDAWFTTANYAGAFDPAAANGEWLKGWTFLDENGKL